MLEVLYLTHELLTLLHEYIKYNAMYTQHSVHALYTINAIDGNSIQIVDSNL